MTSSWICRSTTAELKQLRDELIPIKEFANSGIPSSLFPQICQPFVPPHIDRAKVRWHLLDPIVQFCYRKAKLRYDRHIVLFTWVMAGGFGDLITQRKIAAIIKKRNPQLNIHLVTLTHEKYWLEWEKNRFLSHEIFFRHAEEMHPDFFPREVLTLLRDAAVILQAPTYYPHFNQLWQKLIRLPGNKQLPQMATLREYGFLRAAKEDQGPEVRSLGLHFCERGILIEEEAPANLAKRTASSADWMAKIFAAKKITQDLLERYRSSTLLAFAYLITKHGHLTYLQALLASQMQDLRNIDLVTLDIGEFLQIFASKRAMVLSILQPGGIQFVELISASGAAKLSVQTKGKRLRIIHLGKLSPEDFKQLAIFSEGLFGCRGNLSFSLAISYGKPFFYDGLAHSRFFLADLYWLIHENISPRSVLGEVIDYSLKLATQQRDVESIRKKIVCAIANPKFACEVKQISKVLRQKYAANDFIGDLLCRAVYHHYYPTLADEELKLRQAYFSGSFSFSEFIRKLMKLICDPSF